MSHKRKHSPQRMCVVCRKKMDKRQLTRLVSTPTGVMPDPTGKADGRGAYICDDGACRTRAAETDVLNKALRTALTAEDRQRIRELAP